MVPFSPLMRSVCFVRAMVRRGWVKLKFGLQVWLRYTRARFPLHPPPQSPPHFHIMLGISTPPDLSEDEIEIFVSSTPRHMRVHSTDDGNDDVVMTSAEQTHAPPLLDITSDEDDYSSEDDMDAIERADTLEADGPNSKLDGSKARLSGKQLETWLYDSKPPPVLQQTPRFNRCAILDMHPGSYRHLDVLALQQAYPVSTHPYMVSPAASTLVQF